MTPERAARFMSAGRSVMTRTPWGPAAALIVALIFSASYAAAQEPTAVEMPLADAAKVFGAAEQMPNLAAERDALRDEVAALKGQVARLEKLAAMDAQLLDRQQRMTAFADQETALVKKALDDERARSRTTGFWDKVQTRASQGALLGSLAGSAVPGIGNLGGLAGGAILGGVVGAVESAVAP